MQLSVVMALSMLACSAWAQQDPRHNVVVILADDLGAECLGCYGGTSYQTPELDRLAAAGTRFAQCHTQPLCTPTRLEIMTGLSNARNYVAFSVLPPGSRTFAHLLGDAGYDTGVFGKWQLYAAQHYPESLRGTGTLPEDAGFDQHCLWQVEELGSRYWSPRLRINGETQKFDGDLYGPDVCAERLMAFIAAERDRPFLAYWPMALPHDPFIPPPPKPDQIKKGPKQFAAMVTYMDTLVGRVVRHIEKLGIADRTLVLFVGDNGTSRRIRSQQNGREVPGGKAKPTDAGTHVPMIMWGPGLVPADEVLDQLVCTRDVLPTLVEIAEAPRPDIVDGNSLLPLLRNESPQWRQTLAFWHWPRPQTRPKSQAVQFAIDAQYRLFEDNRMFDRRIDPFCTADPLPADDAGSAAARRRLRQAIDAIPLRNAK